MHALVFATRHQGGCTICPEEDVDDIQRNCWTAFVHILGQLADVQAEFHRLVAAGEIDPEYDPGQW